MGHDFEISREAAVPATPEQVWQAIATGPGIDSWFMGRTDVRPGADGVVRTRFGGYAPDMAVTAWEPPSRFGHHTGTAGDGRFMAYEYLIEGRDGGGAVLRTVTSGFLPGEDWETEYEAMVGGGDLFFATLVAYLTHFAGRAATPVTVFGPAVADWPGAWAALHRELGLPGKAVEGDEVRLDGADGVVYFANSDTLGVRTRDAMYRFMRGFQGTVVAGHHLFTPGADAAEAERAWQAWLHRVFGG